MSIKTIDTSDSGYKACLHKEQPDVPKKTAAETKDFFDSMAEKILVPKINELVEATNKKANTSEVYNVEEAHAEFDPRYSNLVNFEEAYGSGTHITGFCYTGGSNKRCTGLLEVLCDVIEEPVMIEFAAENDSISVTCNDTTVCYIAGELIKIRNFFNINTDELEENEDKLKFSICNYEELYDEDYVSDYHEIYVISLGQLELSDLHKYTYPQEKVYTKEEAHAKFDPKYTRLITLDEACMNGTYITGFCHVGGSGGEHKCTLKIWIREARATEYIDVISEGGVVKVTHDSNVTEYSVGEMVGIHDFFDTDGNEYTYLLQSYSVDGYDSGYTSVYLISSGALELSDLHKYTHPKTNVYTRKEVDTLHDNIRNEFYPKESVYTKDETVARISGLLFEGLNIDVPLMFIASSESIMSSGKFELWKNYTLFTVITPLQEEVSVYFRISNQVSIFFGTKQFVIPVDDDTNWLDGFEGCTVISVSEYGEEFIRCISPHLKEYLDRYTEKFYSNTTVDELHRKMMDLLFVGSKINTPLVFMASGQSLRDSERFVQFTNYILFKALTPAGDETEVYLKLGNQFSIFGGKNQIILADDDSCPHLISGYEGYEITEVTPLGEELIRCISPHMDLYLKYYINQSLNITGE